MAIRSRPLARYGRRRRGVYPRSAFSAGSEIGRYQGFIEDGPAAGGTGGGTRISRSASADQGGKP